MYGNVEKYLVYWILLRYNIESFIKMLNVDIVIVVNENSVMIYIVYSKCNYVIEGSGVLLWFKILNLEFYICKVFL